MIKEVKILTDWICSGENQKGKVGKWNVDYLDSIKIQYEIVKNETVQPKSK